MSGNDNPGNFANRPKEEVQEIASKGGQASHNSGFASMDPDKQVCKVSESCPIKPQLPISSTLCMC
jgi:general stress protein YciG